MEVFMTHGLPRPHPFRLSLITLRPNKTRSSPFREICFLMTLERQLLDSWWGTQKRIHVCLCCNFLMFYSASATAACRARWTFCLALVRYSYEVI